MTTWRLSTGNRKREIGPEHALCLSEVMVLFTPVPMTAGTLALNICLVSRRHIDLQRAGTAIC